MISLRALTRNAPSLTTARLFRPMSSSAEPTILSTRSASGKVALLTLNRPKGLNALNSELMARLNDELEAIEREDAVGAVVVAGAGERAFAGESRGWEVFVIARCGETGGRGGAE